jgi:MFS family permease
MRNRGGYGELLRSSRAFRLLWFAQIASLFGDWFNVIASSTLLAQLTGAGAALGALFAIRMLGSFLASPLAGVLADRYNRKRILIATDLLRAAAVLGLLLVREPHHVWLLFTLTALQVGISGVFFPVRVAILPEVASRRLLGPANALSSATWAAMLALGAAAGGVFAGVFGIAAAFILDAATYLLSALLLIRMPYAARDKRSAAAAPASLGASVQAGIAEYAESLRYLGKHTRVLVVALQKGFLSIFFSAFQVVSVAIAGTVFPIGVGGGTTVGLLFAAGGVGSALGPLVIQPLLGARQQSLRWAMLAGYLLMCAGLALAAPLGSLPLVMIGAALRSVGSGLVWVFSTQILLETVPDELRGRVIATEHAAFTLLGAVGSAAAGAGLELLPLSTLVWLLAPLTLLPGLHWAIYGVRQARKTR